MRRSFSGALADALADAAEAFRRAGGACCACCPDRPPEQRLAGEFFSRSMKLDESECLVKFHSKPCSGGLLFLGVIEPGRSWRSCARGSLPTPERPPQC